MRVILTLICELEFYEKHYKFLVRNLLWVTNNGASEHLTR